MDNLSFFILTPVRIYLQSPLSRKIKIFHFKLFLFDSKIVFNVLAVICLCFTTGQFWEEYPRLEPKVLPFDANNSTNATVFDYCQNVCNVMDISICNTFNQSEELYHGILIALWVLLALSTLEGILESFLFSMTHCQFLQEIPREDKNASAVPEEAVELQNNPAET